MPYDGTRAKQPAADSGRLVPLSWFHITVRWPFMLVETKSDKNVQPTMQGLTGH